MTDVELLCNTNVGSILGNKVIPIEESYDVEEKYRSVLERYYTVRYVLNVGTKRDDYCILFHSNRVCVITLAPSHFLLENKTNIVSVDFQVKPNINYKDISVKGRLKRGAQYVPHASAVLFYVEGPEKTISSIRASLPGKIVEINKEIEHDPNIIIRDPLHKGYLAIVIPNIPNYNKYKDEYLTQEQYEKEVQNVCKST